MWHMPGQLNHGGGSFFRLLLLLGAAWMVVTLSANAADRIDYISLTGRTSVVIHYTTRANRMYILQSINHLTCTPNTVGCNAQGYPTNWSNIHTGFALPFSVQYHILDDRAPARQFYRLRVSAP